MRDELDLPIFHVHGKSDAFAGTDLLQYYTSHADSDDESVSVITEDIMAEEEAADILPPVHEVRHNAGRAIQWGVYGLSLAPIVAQLT